MRPRVCVAVVLAMGMVTAAFAAAAAGFTLTGLAFGPEATIPKRFTCDGADVSPPLRWGNPPGGTRSIAISVIDLDAHRFVHWLAWGLSPTRRGLAAGQHPPQQALNGFGNRGYGGPCPPPGRRHRYRFSLYALDASVGPPFRHHVLAVARMTAFYGR
jgi:Raf kinase inhibitor-like YbhB/YbcL family protein